MPYSAHTVRPPCTVEGCSGKQVARGYCEAHYRRWLHNGNLETKRPADWGSREKHPLFGRWTWFRRSKVLGLGPEWHNDFWRFVRDVGEQPSPRHRLLRRDPTKPYGPENFLWEESVTTNLNAEEKKAYLRDWIRGDRERNPDKYRDKGLKKLYGIGLVEYNAMLEKQGGVCAICGEANEIVDTRTKKIRRLAVDHCHAKGSIRKLLCHYCNAGLGAFKDRPDLLRKAADYLEKH